MNAQPVSNISSNGVGVDEQHASGTLSVDSDYNERTLVTQAISSNVSGHNLVDTSRLISLIV